MKNNNMDKGNTLRNKVKIYLHMLGTLMLYVIYGEIYHTNVSH